MCSVGRLPIRFTVGTGGTISYCLVRSILERTDTIAVVGQVAQFNLTTKTQSWRGRVRSVFERTDNIAVVGQWCDQQKIAPFQGVGYVFHPLASRCPLQGGGKQENPLFRGGR